MGGDGLDEEEGDEEEEEEGKKGTGTGWSRVHGSPTLPLHARSSNSNRTDEDDPQKVSSLASCSFPPPTHSLSAATASDSAKMESLTSVLISLYHPFPRTLSLSLPSSTPVSTLASYLPLPSSSSSDAQHLLQYSTGRSLPSPSSAATLSQLTNASTGFVALRLSVRLQGGKGGFASQLRAQGGRMSSNKAQNTDSCRGLDGRRLSTIKEAQKYVPPLPPSVYVKHLSRRRSTDPHHLLSLFPPFSSLRPSSNRTESPNSSNPNPTVSPPLPFRNKQNSTSSTPRLQSWSDKAGLNPPLPPPPLRRWLPPPGQVSEGRRRGSRREERGEQGEG